MPKEFVKCVRNGGKVKTKDLGNNKYMHICYDKDGNSHAGEVLLKKKPKKKKAKSNRTHKEMVSGARATLGDLQRLKEHFNSNRQ